LLTEDLKKMLFLSVIIGILTAIGEYYLAFWLDASIAGSMATVVGFFFMLAVFFSPSSGYFFKQKRHLTSSKK